MSKVIFAAYGSLLDAALMEQILGKTPTKFEGSHAKILDYRLHFDTFATIVPDVTDYVPVGLWVVDEEDLPKLDAYENCPVLYTRTTVRVWYEVNHGGAQVINHCDAEVYIMTASARESVGEEQAPAKYYIDQMANGYREFGLDKYKLIRAYNEAINRG